MLLIQLPIPPLGLEPIRGNVPLAAGYLKLWARRQGLEERCDIEVLPAAEANRLGDEALVERLAEARPWLAGFTCYLWNIDRTLWVAQRLKELCPETQIVLGGPEITPDNGWVLESAGWDFAVVGEGEQTFSELVAARLTGGAHSHGAIAGLIHREEGVLVTNPRRRPLPELDLVSSPYLEGILSAGDEEQLLLETVRGCIFKCKFCYYPKAYDGLYFVSRQKVLANLAHAREAGAREVYLLDPTLNQRRDFAEFLELLKEGNPGGTADRRLEYHAELRAEGIRPEHARLMREANFKEVEVGLQSIDATAQELMERRNSLKAFERGVRALQEEGVKVKVDLIVGLPGDTVESVRAGMRYLADTKLFDDVQVFQLSILPGTDFRREAASLGLEHQPRPPYYVLRTPALSLDEIMALQEEAEDIFDVEFDPELPPSLNGGAGALEIDLDSEQQPLVPPHPPLALSLRLRSRNLYARLPRAMAVIRELLARNPFTTLEIILETNEDFPFDVFAALRKACERPENIYLDRFYEFTPRSRLGARRIVTLFPEARRPAIDPDWVDGALAHSNVVWDPRGSAIL